MENFLRYVDAGFYTDTVFHRVIPKFVVQGGGFTPELDLKPTFEPTPIETKNGLTNDRGAVAMARMDDKDSATSQFFINLDDNEQLNRGGFRFGYTVFGRVVEGMNVVDAIARVQTSKRRADGRRADPAGIPRPCLPRRRVSYFTTPRLDARMNATNRLTWSSASTSDSMRSRACSVLSPDLVRMRTVLCRRWI